MEKIAERVIGTDVLIVGSEGAGSRAAIEVSKYKGVKPTIATKGLIAKCGATLTADMDIDVPSKAAKEVFGLPGGDERDDERSFMEDMFLEGKFMNNEEVVWAHVSNATPYVKELVQWGMSVEGLIRSPGHKYPRGIISTGRSMMEALKKQVKGLGVELIEDTMVTDLLMSDGRCAGAVGLNMRTGEFVVIKAKAVILATGGAMRIYPRTTAPEELTGDGIAMAFRAGAELVDMEFPMFLPACIVWPPSMNGVDLPYISSTVLGGWWLNKYGERFMEKWDPKRMEKDTTRDIASIAQTIEILEGRGGPHGGIFVSYSHLPRALLDFSADWAVWWKGYEYGGFKLSDFGMDLKETAFEAAPAAHYWNGGVRINARCETNVAGLYAAGEIQGGTMGANRLSGNAVTECLVFGALSGKAAAEYARGTSAPKVDKGQIEGLRDKVLEPMERKKGISPIGLRKRIQKIAFDYVGPVREGPGIEKALLELEKIKKDELPMVYSSAKTRCYNREWVEALEIGNMVTVLEIVSRASLMRTESRGAMYRRDCPNTDNKNWLKNIIVKLVGEKIKLETMPIVIKTVKPPKSEVIPYWVPEK